MTLRSLIAGSIISSAALLTLPILAQQQPTPPAQSTSTQNTQKKDQPNKSPAQENPFPEAQSEAAAHQQTGSEPNAPQPQSPKTMPQSPSQNKTGDQNPFPQAQSEKASHTTDNPKPASPSSDDQNYSSSRVSGLDMPAADAASAVPAPSIATSLPYNPKLARKDAEIGDFYMESGNFKGAYERFLEANRSDPGNAEAVYGLGESARHLDRRDEALRNYHLYLAALPNGPHAKEIRKAMKEMGADPAP